MQWVASLVNGARAAPTSAAKYERITLSDMEQGGPAPEEGALLEGRASEDGNAVPRVRESVVLDQAASKPPEVSRVAFLFWVAVNCLATLAIVLVNKSVLSNPTLRGAPTLFVAYHFFLTGVTLHIASSGLVNAFPRKSAPILSLLPLVLVFASHVLISNWSLALLEVAIYQEIRILVTPATVIINFFAYRKTISLQSLLALGIVCGGIGLTVYSDTLQKLALQQAAAMPSPSDLAERALLLTRSESIHALKNTPIGYAFGFAGVFLSALYTVWMAVYLKKLELSSMQLLALQSPLGCSLLLLATPLLDTLPVWSAITPHEYFLIFLSGLCAVLINVSQFFIVAGSSALSSTVVGHGKTCLIVAAGWFTATSAISLGSGIGIIVAVIGIVAYSAIGLHGSK